VIRPRSSDKPVPPSLENDAAQAARRDAESFFAIPAEQRAQKRFFFDDGIFEAPDVKSALWELFAGKCAYCESPFSPERPLRVDHFRPLLNAVGLDGAVSPDHYWWLALDWENFLPACPECARLKGPRFPVANRRAEHPAHGDELAREEPLLLDLRHDHPEEHLVYVDDGTVVANSERGRVTIEVLGLNRSELVSDRRAALTQAHAEWLALAEDHEPAATELEQLYAASRGYAAMRRQFLTTWAAGHDRKLAADVLSMTDEVDRVVTRSEQRRLKSSYVKRAEEQEAYSLATAKGGNDYFVRTRLIDRVVVRDMRVIEELELVATSPTRYWAPWMMLLGENGTGKSSMLQVIAMALMGDRHRQRLKLEPKSFLRHGARKGSVEVYLSGGSDPLRLEFTRTRFTSNEPDPKVLLLGYGATRLLPRTAGQGRRKRPIGGAARVDNLFDPFASLPDATDWLLQLPRGQFNAVARALTGILALDQEATLHRNGRAGRIEVEMADHRIPLQHLSDGYQSVLAFAVDIITVMLQRWESMEVAEGIVIVDELGAHLHPRWRMRIVGALREVFPRVQFIASTHDPLCLRGVLDGEVAVLRRRPDGEVFKVSDLPPVEGLRVDQLLTSEHFGLDSTIDPELDRLFARYYDLKGRWTLNDAERVELDGLSAKLDDLHLLGRNRRERLMIEATDDYLARENRVADDESRRELRDSTKQRIVDLWEETEPTVGVVPPL
jgi:5-methylcytosine-specific restriction endonuclease McrA